MNNGDKLVIDFFKLQEGKSIDEVFENLDNFNCVIVDALFEILIPKINKKYEKPEAKSKKKKGGKK